MFPGKTC